MDQDIKVGDLLLYKQLHVKDDNIFGVAIDINFKNNNLVKCYWITPGYHTFEFTEKVKEYKKNAEYQAG